MTTEKLRQWFDAEQNDSHCCYSTMIGSYNDKYVDWLERRLVQSMDRHQDNEADGIVFCGKCGKQK